jgi:uncharacterized protein (TIGR00251 family)
LIREFPWGVEIDVRVIPRAKRSEIGGVRGDAILVRLSAPPVEGAANAALVDFLADLLDVPRRAVRIVSGAQSRLKRVAIDGVTARRMSACVPTS